MVYSANGLLRPDGSEKVSIEESGDSKFSMVSMVVLSNVALWLTGVSPLPADNKPLKRNIETATPPMIKMLKMIT